MATVLMTLDVTSEPPRWDPENIEIAITDFVDFQTNDSSTQTIEITDPRQGTRSLEIPDPSWAPEEVGTYHATYNHKGGTTTGNVTVIVNE